MATKSLRRLNREYETENYFDIIKESYINGNFTQCREQYRELTLSDRKLFLIEIVTEMGADATRIMERIL